MIQHLLVILHVFVLPIVAFFDIRKLKSNPTTRYKIITYWKVIGWLWLTVILIMTVYPLRQIFYSPITVPLNAVTICVITGILLYFAATNIFPIILMWRSPSFRENVSRHYDKRRFIYPDVKAEQRMFILLSISVGICEEVIFRFFLVEYFYEVFPFQVTFWLSFLLAGVIFGLVHYLQGSAGIVQATIVGMTLGYLYYVTGNLLLSIAIHIVLDLRILLVNRSIANIHNHGHNY